MPSGRPRNSPNPPGQPTKYRQEYVGRVVEFCAEGYSLTGFAGEIGVDRDTITEWGNVHPDFGRACRTAKAARARWWEERARQVAIEGGPGGQATMVIFGLKNHAPEDYNDRQQHVLSGPDGRDLIADADPIRLALAVEAIIAAARRKTIEHEPVMLENHDGD